MLVPKFGVYEVLSKDETQQIHQASISVLENVGVKINDRDTLEFLGRSGCEVDFKSSIAKIPENLVLEAIKNAPRRVTLAGRNQKFDLLLEDKRVHFGTGSGCLNIVDLETGQRRPTCKKDIEDCARLSDGLPNVDFVMSLAVSQDVPKQSSPLHDLEAMLRNTEKPIISYDYGLDAGSMIKMAAAVVGGEDELRKRPIICLDSQPVSPLTHDIYIRNARTFARAGLPQVCVSGPKLGVTGPVTVAGWVVLANAEVLSVNVIAQLTRKGTPFIFGFGAPVMDLKTTVVSYGAPEFMLTNLIETQMARNYGFPSWSTVGSDSKVLDGQALAETAMCLYNSALSGANIVHDMGFFDSGLTASLELVTISDELVSSIGRVLAGVRVSTETLATDLISKIGIGGRFLAERHTTQNVKYEYWDPRLIDRQTRSSWLAKGAKDLIQRARERAQEVLRSHKVTALPEHVQKELTRIVAEAEKPNAR